jgi:hypothetical protein
MCSGFLCIRDIQLHCNSENGRSATQVTQVTQATQTPKFDTSKPVTIFSRWMALPSGRWTTVDHITMLSNVNRGHSRAAVWCADSKTTPSLNVTVGDVQIYVPPLNSRCSKSDTQVPYWESTNIRHNHIKSGDNGGLVSGICRALVTGTTRCSAPHKSWHILRTLVQTRGISLTWVLWH